MCVYVHNQISYFLAAGVIVDERVAILDILLKSRPMAWWRSFICSPAAVTILPVTMHYTLDEGESA